MSVPKMGLVSTISTVAHLGRQKAFRAAVATVPVGDVVDVVLEAQLMKNIVSRHI